LSSETSSVLLHGVPGKVFHCRRGLRQGDPLSPLLFVLAADLLQIVINDAKENNPLSLPLPERDGTDFPIVQYADDTLLVMEACPRQLQNLKELLYTFSSSTGLLIPKIGTGKRLTCGPSLVKKHHSAGNFPQSIR
jgi:hypothetical protein